jgi:hypothetical protein
LHGISTASPTYYIILLRNCLKDIVSNKQSDNNYVEDNLTYMALALNEFVEGGKSIT